MTDLNNVTNKLLNEYQIKFNENYNDIVQLDSTIKNKDQIINEISNHKPIIRTVFYHKNNLKRPPI